MGMARDARSTAQHRTALIILDLRACCRRCLPLLPSYRLCYLLCFSGPIAKLTKSWRRLLERAKTPKNANPVQYFPDSCSTFLLTFWTPRAAACCPDIFRGDTNIRASAHLVDTSHHTTRLGPSTSRAIVISRTSSSPNNKPHDTPPKRASTLQSKVLEDTRPLPPPHLNSTRHELYPATPPGLFRRWTPSSPASRASSRPS